MFVYKDIVSSELIDYLKPKFEFFARHNFVVRWQDKMFKSCLQNFLDGTIVLMVNFTKTTTLKFRMKYNPCTNIATKWLFLFTLLGLRTHTLTLMMQPFKPIWNIISTFLMIKVMTIILFNTVYFCIGKILWTMAWGQNNIRFSQMVHSSRARSLVYSQ